MLTDFYEGYLEALLLCCTSEFEDAERSLSTMTDEGKKIAKDTCTAFYKKHRALLEEAINAEDYSMEQAGTDFWLTRNGHGTGFWDRGLGAVGEALTGLCGYGTEFPANDDMADGWFV